MNSEKESFNNLLTDSLVEIDLLIINNQNLSQTTSLDFLIYIKEALESLKINLHSYQSLDKQILSKFENAMTMCARGLEDTILNEKINELGNILLNYGLFSEFQEIMKEMDE